MPRLPLACRNRSRRLPSWSATVAAAAGMPIGASKSRQTRAAGARPDESRLDLVSPHLSGPTGKPWPRPRARARALALRLLRLGRRLGGQRRLLLVGREGLVLRGAAQQGDELLGVDRLPLEQDLRDAVELRVLLGQQVLGGLVRVFDDAADLVVDLARDLIRVVGLGRELAAQEGLTAVMAEDSGAEPL